MDAVALDSEPSKWLTQKRKHYPLVPGLPIHPHLRWAVGVDPAVGESFLGPWKAHCMDLVRQRQEDVRVGVARPGRPKRKPAGPALPRSPRPGTKGKRKGTAPPPSQSQQHAWTGQGPSPTAQGGSLSLAGSSSAPRTGGPPSPGGGPGLLSPGVLT